MPTPRVPLRAALATAALGLLAVAPTALASSELRVTRDISSATGRHVWYQQVVDGLPLVGGEVYVNEDTAGKTVQRSSALAASVTGVDGAFAVAEADALQGGLAAAGAPAGAQVSALQAAFPQGARAIPAWVVRVVSETAPIDDEVVLDGRTGAVLSLRNDAKHANGTVQVFAPNPVVTLNDHTLRDRGNADFAALAGAYFSRPAQGLDGSGYLRGQWVDTTVHTPNASRAFSTNGRFEYTRADGRFEAAMAYYWIDRTQRNIQDLGFGSALDPVNREQQDVSIDSVPDDNSWYTPSLDRITYGVGGVDDAEDADIILHEYGHAMQDAQVPGFGQLEEGGAMGEGFGDYWAGDQTYKDTTKPPTGGPGRDTACIGDWDSVSYSPGPAPCLRRLDGRKHYPGDIDGEVHDDGELWSAVLWQIRDKVGSKIADRVILESHFLLNPRSRFVDGAQAIIRADGALYGGSHAGAIRKLFKQRGIL